MKPMNGVRETAKTRPLTDDRRPRNAKTGLIPPTEVVLVFVYHYSSAI